MVKVRKMFIIMVKVRIKVMVNVTKHFLTFAHRTDHNELNTAFSIYNFDPVLFFNTGSIWSFDTGCVKTPAVHSLGFSCREAKGMNHCE